MTFKKHGVVALALAITGFTAQPALAIYAIPNATPYGTATDVLTLNGTYSGDPGSPAQLFGSPDFTLSLTVPSQVSITAYGPDFSQFIIPVSGSYTDAGQTVTFTNGSSQSAYADFGNIDPSLAGDFSLVVSGLLSTGDAFTLSFQADGPLFSPTEFAHGVPQIVSIALGSLDVTNGLAGYGVDPPFTGTLDVTSASAVPEPLTVSLVGAGLLGAIALRRRKMKSA